MSHEISIQAQGAEIAYAGDTPWHGLGTRVEGLQTAQEMLIHAHMDWIVSAWCIEALSPSSPDENNPETISVPEFRAIVREDTQAILGMVSDRYMPIQNTQAADMVDALVTEGHAHVEVAGALGQGERCWMLARIPGEFEVVKGDAIRPYFLLAWGHDGKHGLAGKLTPIRVVCNNTLTAAGFGGKGKWSKSADVYVRHSAAAKVNIEEARRALGLVQKQTEATQAAFQALAAKNLDAKGKKAEKYFGTVFPEPDALTETASLDEKASYYEKLVRWNEHQLKLLELYDQGPGTEVSGVRGTAWAAYNAITQYTDHVYPIMKSGEVSKGRQQSVLFGLYQGVKDRALFEALAL